jgi:hypothetical protein
MSAPEAPPIGLAAPQEALQEPPLEVPLELPQEVATEWMLYFSTPFSPLVGLPRFSD